MKLLLDTHILLWWMDDSRELSRAAVKLIASPSSIVFVSAVSIWEIRIKERLGKLDLPKNFSQALEKQSFEQLPITFDDANEIGRLPPFHQDPFDRMLVAQALLNDLTLVTHDKILAKYPIRTEIV